jgi:hypothetical protein
VNAFDLIVLGLLVLNTGLVGILTVLVVWSLLKRKD